MTSASHFDIDWHSLYRGGNGSKPFVREPRDRPLRSLSTRNEIREVGFGCLTSLGSNLMKAFYLGGEQRASNIDHLAPRRRGARAVME